MLLGEHDGQLEPRVAASRLLGAALRRQVLLGLAATGFALSLVLELLHYRAYAAPAATSFCTLTAHFDCASVALSRWSVLLGVPLPLWGALGFGALGTAAWLRSRWVVPLAVAAAVASVALLGVELALVHSLCLLCEAVHVVAFALAVVAWRGRHELAAFGERGHAVLVLLPPVGVLVALLLFLPPYWREFGWKGALPFAEGVTTDGAPWVGAREPKLTLEEYTDYLCPHCRVASAWTLKRLAARPGDIRIVRRQLPLSRCHAEQPKSCERVRLAYCAGEQRRFWQMDRWLFAHADELKLDHSAIARELGLDAAALEKCVARRDILERAQRESDASWKRRFVGTPSYVVNGKRIPPETADRYLAQGRPD